MHKTTLNPNISRDFLRLTFGEEHFQENLEFIEPALGKPVRKYFLKDFYKDHVQRYKKRPIYWQFSSPKGSFNALIYMHRYRPDTVSVILNEYLREFRTKLGARIEQLEQIEVSGFKSISGREAQKVEFGDITILLGANGAGKSNLLSLLRMLGFLTTGALQQFVGKAGARQLLFRGPKTTEAIRFEVSLQVDDTTDIYEARLAYGLPDRLFVSGERVSYHQRGFPKPQEYFLSEGGGETKLAEDDRTTSKVLTALLRGIQTFQFHDTSDTARIKDRVYIDDSGYLRGDAGNLAAFLKRLKDSNEHRKYYDRIVRHIRSIMPQFGGFVLEPLSDNERYLRLNWTDSDKGDYLFGPDQISDGSLRFMALTTLLMQPPELLPRVSVIDEPELGLHPAAVRELAGMIKRASTSTLIVLATQSTRLIDEFSADQIVVVERDPASRSSVFKRLDAEALAEWLTNYTLAELWEKSVLGASRDKRINREYRGGLTTYQRARRDIETWMKQDGGPTCWFTTMFDLYGLPSDFPGISPSPAQEPYQRVAALEQALANDIKHPRFIPYIQLHEFETLLLADIRQLDWEYLEHDRQISRLVEMVGDGNPELINEGADTAPSKRILREIPQFDKATSGVVIAERIGLATLRQRCAHFEQWVTKLEALGQSA